MGTPASIEKISRNDLLWSAPAATALSLRLAKDSHVVQCVAEIHTSDVSERSTVPLKILKFLATPATLPSHLARTGQIDYPRAMTQFIASTVVACLSPIDLDALNQDLRSTNLPVKFERAWANTKDGRMVCLFSTDDRADLERFLKLKHVRVEWILPVETEWA